MSLRRKCKLSRSRPFGGSHRFNARRPLRFEPLEDRRLLSITVDTLVDENDGIGVGTGTSLREAIAAAAPGDTINFSVTGTINLSYVASNFTRHLAIDKSLTIQGPGADLLTIQAFDPTPTQRNGDGSRVFLIDDGITTSLSNVSISGVTIAGGDNNTAGGAIFAKENLTLSNSVVTGNTTTQSSRTAGGAGIYSNNGSATPNSLSVFGCTFTGNVATNSEGGAIRKRYGRLLVNGCSITNNSATYAGGISAADGAIVAQIQNCDISLNHATAPIAGGGAIVAVSGSLTIAGSTINNNTSVGKGAGIYAVAESLLSLQNTTLSGNTTTSDGGGIYAQTTTDLELTDCVLTNNGAARGAGIEGTPVLLNITRTTFDTNKATGIGGGIYVAPTLGTVNINGGAFLNNQADKGAGMFVVATLNVNDCEISGNTATTSGGGIYIAPAARSPGLSLKRSTLRNNSAKNGGGVYSDYSTTITGSLLDSNHATAGAGGGIYGASFTIDQSQITNNTATTNGGGIAGVTIPGATGAITLKNSTISGNSAATGGGVFNSVAGMTITGSFITGNSATTNGGGILSNATTTVTSSHITTNNAANGAGIYGASLTIDQTEISGNTATTNGGGIESIKISGGAQGPVVVKNSTISGNSANAGGGAFNSGNDLTVTDSTVSGNSATVQGGGLYAGSTVHLTRSTITANTAPEGRGSGVVAAFGSLSTYVQSTIIAGNAHSDINFGDGPNPFHSNSFNLIGTGTTATFNQTGDQVGVLDPKLAPLADNGGTTKTHALLAGSPALDAGDFSVSAGVDATPAYDQRGKPMTRVANGRIDIGAYESQPIPAAFMGDYNNDGFVNTLDYIVWRHAKGATGLTPYTGADGTGDGIVGPDDYTLWRSHFGAVVPSVPIAGSGSALVANQSVVKTNQPIALSPSFDPLAAIFPGSLVAAATPTTSKSLKQASNISQSSHDQVLSAWLTFAARDSSANSIDDGHSDSADSTDHDAANCVDAAFESLDALLKV